MVSELLPDVPLTIFRPSIVLGDSRHAETTQFDMVRSFVSSRACRFSLFDPTIESISSTIRRGVDRDSSPKERPEYEIYHLSSGTQSQTFRELRKRWQRCRKRGAAFLPSLRSPSQAL